MARRRVRTRLRSFPRRGRRLLRSECLLRVGHTEDMEQLLELRAHRDIQQFTAGEPPLEPGGVEPDDLAALGHLAEAALDDGGEVGVVAAVHEAVRVVGQIFADDFVPPHAVRLGDQPIEQHIVSSERLHLARLEQGEGGGVIRGADDPDAQPLLVAERLQRRLVGGARRHGHQLAGELSVAADRRALLHRQLGAGDEDHRREGHLLLPQPVVGGRAAFEVDVAAAQQGEAVLRGDRLVADLDWPDAQFGGRLRDDLLAEVDRVADRAAAWIEEGEGDRTLPDPQRDRPAVPDLLQRAGQLVGREARGREDRQHAGEDDETEPHDTLPQAGSARTSAKSSAALCSSPSHLLTAAVASELPSTLVAERPMSRNWSMPMISSRPASGMLNWFSVAAMTTSEARGTPAMPLLVSISTSSMVISWARESSIL